MGTEDLKTKGGFWLDTNLWGARGEAAARLLKKGARVVVSGELYEDTWQDKETGEDRSRVRLRAENVDLDLNRLDNVMWRSRGNDNTE